MSKVWRDDRLCSSSASLDWEMEGTETETLECDEASRVIEGGGR